VTSGSPRPLSPDGRVVIRSEIFGGSGRVAHAFGTRLGGVSRSPFESLNLGMSVGDDPEAVRENRRRFFGAFGLDPARVVRVRQVHGDRICRVDEALAARPGFPQILLDEGAGYDGLVTDRSDVALVVTTADCQPILIHDPVHGAVAAVHAGWRGTAKGIVTRVLSVLASAYGSRPEECLAAVGPSIRGCCYEVDAAVTGAMAAALPGWEAHAVPTRPGHVRLDLAGINRALLEASGLRPDRIADTGLCTSCRTDLFFSHRAEKGRTGRMMNFILLRS
jgi:YfiH family protein